MKSRELKEMFFEGLFDAEVKYMELMKHHTSLGMGGPADIFAVPRDTRTLADIRVYLRKNNIPFFPLGGGTNILVRDGGIEGAVISLRALGKIGPAKEDGEGICLFVEAGVPLQKLVHFSKEKACSGIEGLAGIPGTVGGAICGNAGSFGYEMKDVLVSADIMDAEGKIRRFEAGEIAFGYRSSGISQNQLLLSAEIRLKKEKIETVSARIDDYLKLKREKQPLWERSAGCVFKNPHGLSAGKLIDEAGCKGMRIGGVEVSTVHANFFVNKGDARASEFLLLMEEVASRVKARTGIVLEPEIRIVGREGADG